MQSSDHNLRQNYTWFSKSYIIS